MKNKTKYFVFSFPYDSSPYFHKDYTTEREKVEKYATLECAFEGSVEEMQTFWQKKYHEWYPEKYPRCWDMEVLIKIFDGDPLEAVNFLLDKMIDIAEKLLKKD